VIYFKVLIDGKDGHYYKGGFTSAPKAYAKAWGSPEWWHLLRFIPIKMKP